MVAFYLSCVVIATVPIYFAAVQAWVWPFYAAAMMLAYILFRWQNRLDKAKTSWLWILLGSIFSVWMLLQSVPLPAELIEKLSPFRYRALSDGAALAGIGSNPSSLSYNRFTSLGWWILLLSIAMFFIVLQNTLNDSDRFNLLGRRAGRVRKAAECMALGGKR